MKIAVNEVKQIAKMIASSLHPSTVATISL